MFSRLCPKLFWAVHDETLYKSLSSNEFLRGRIRKLSPLSFISFFFFLPTLFSFINVFPFRLFSSWSMAIWCVCGGGGGGPSDYTGEMRSQCEVICQK